MTTTLINSDRFNVAPLDPRFDWGVVVTGLNLASLAEAEVRRQLYDLWMEAGVVVFRGLEGGDAQIALSRIFGPLRDHPSPETVSAGARELIDVRYEPENGQVCLFRGEVRGMPLPWHSDLMYVDKINRGGILRPLKLPSHLGETGFVDKISAYADLPEDIKRRIQGLHVVYKFDVDLARIKFGPDRGSEMVRFSEISARMQTRLHEYPNVTHPLVFEQPETSRKVLNLSPWFADHIQEIPTAEGDELLEYLAQHIAADDRAYYHPWKLGEMLLWDNWRMLHCSMGAPVAEERYLQRTTIGGDYGLGRLAPAG